MKNNNIPHHFKAALAAAGLHTGRIAQIALAIVITSLAATARAQTWTGNGTTNNWSDGANWSTNVAPTTGGTIVWDATSTNRLVSNNDIVGLSLNQINYLNAPAGVVLTGNAVTLTDAQPFGTSTTTTASSITINLDLALPASTTLRRSISTVFNGVLSGAGTAFNVPSPGVAGEGTYAFYGENTFSAPTVILGDGTVAASTILVNTLKNSGLAQSLGTGSLVQFGATGSAANARLYYTGGTTSTDKGFQIGNSADNQGTGGVFANGTGALTWSGAQTVATSATNRTFTLGGFNTDANTWSSAIGNNNSGTVALTKDGRGTWALSGANTFTGALTVNSGTLVLDYANNATVINSGNAVTLGGSILEFKGKAGAGNSTTQTLGNLTATDVTGLSTIRINQNGGDGVALTLGTVSVNPTFYYGPSSVLFDLNGSSGSSVKIGTAITPGSGTNNGRILIRTAAGQYDFAHNSNNTANALVAVNSTTQIGATTGSWSTDYVFYDTATIGTGGGDAIVTRSLRIAPTQNNQVMTISNASASFSDSPGLRVAGAGLLFDGGVHDFTIKASDGKFAPIAVGNGGNDEISIYHMGTGKLTIDENIYLNRDTNGGFYFSGTQGGLVDFRGRVVNDGTGGTSGSAAATRAAYGFNGDIVVRVSGATDTIRYDNATTGIGPATIRLGGGGVFELAKAETLTRNLTTDALQGSIRWTGDGGFSAFGGDRTVNLGGGTSAQVTWGSGGFVPDGNALVLSSKFADSRIDFQNPLDLGPLQRVVQVANGAAVVDARLSGILSGGLTGGLVKEGLGTLELTADNTYGGETWVRAGTLLVNGNQSAAKGLVTVFADAAIGGSGTIGGDLTLADGSFFAFDPTATLTVTGTVTLDNSFGINSLVGADWSTLTLGSPYTLIAGTGNFSSINNFAADNAEDVGGGRFAYFQEGSLQLVVIPEPGTLALMGLAGLALLAGRRRRK